MPVTYESTRLRTQCPAELLRAMTGPHNTHVKQDFAWIAQRPFPLADLHARRAAGLVRAIRSIQGARGVRQEELQR